jgi:hypothetical protein
MGRTDGLKPRRANYDDLPFGRAEQHSASLHRLSITLERFQMQTVSVFAEMLMNRQGPPKGGRGFAIHE